MSINVEKKFITSTSSLSEMNRFLNEYLDKTKIEKNIKHRYIIAVESIVPKLIKQGKEDTSFSIRIKSNNNKTKIYIEAKGPEIKESLDRLLYDEFFANENMDDEDLKDFAKNTLGLDISHKYKYKCNTFRISNANVQTIKIRTTLTCMLAAAIFGLTIRFLCPETISDIIATNFLSLFYGMFLKALKLIIGPMIFFSITTSIASYTNGADIKKIAWTTFKVFFSLTCISVLLALSADRIFQLTDESLSQTYAASLNEVTSGDSSNLFKMFTDTIDAMIPNNIITPFSSSIITQIIFLAVLFGFAFIKLGDKVKPLLEIFQKIDLLINKMMQIIVAFMPIAVFCSLSSTFITLDVSSLITLTKLVGIVFMGFACIILIDLLLVRFLCKINLKHYIKSMLPVCLVSMMLASSAAAMPDSIKTNIEKLNIPKKIAFFSIPLGTTINLNGGIFTVSFISLFFMRVCGVDFNAVVLLVFVINVLCIAMGSPAVPGGAIVLITTVVSAFNLPVDIVNLVVGIYPLIDMFSSMTNTNAIAAGTQIINKLVQKK